MTIPSSERGAIVLSKRMRGAKLEQLAAAEGYESVDDLIEAAQFDCVIPGICTAEECGYTIGVEPDQDQGHCEACGQQRVQSALVLAGLI